MVYKIKWKNFQLFEKTMLDLLGEKEKFSSEIGTPT